MEGLVLNMARLIVFALQFFQFLLCLSNQYAAVETCIAIWIHIQLAMQLRRIVRDVRRITGHHFLHHRRIAIATH